MAKRLPFVVIVAIAAIVILGCSISDRGSGEPDQELHPGGELPLVGDEPSFHHSSGYVCFTCWYGTEDHHLFVSVYGLRVELRADGYNYTSLLIPPGDGLSLLGDVHDRGVILVPLEEDIVLWQNWIERKKREYEEYIDNLPPPRRVIPND